MRTLQTVMTLPLAIAFVACTQAPQPAPQPTTEADMAAIGQLRDQFTSAYNAADAARVADLYVDDAVIMPQNQAAITGKDGIHAFNQTLFDQFTPNITISPDESKILGDWAFDRGTFTVTLTPKAGGKPMEDTGKYLVLLQRQADGSWKVARDIDNSSKPLPAPTSKAQ